jgi:outer membrane biosynthesis protein TonB
MFDDVGRSNERQKGRRVVAFFTSIGLNATIFATLVWAGSRVVEQVEKKDEAIAVPVDLAAPPPPPPPPPAGGGHKKKTEHKKEEEKPKEEIPQPVVPLPDEVPPPVETPDEPEGDPAGQEGGVKDGVADGVVGGVKDGVVGGQLGAPQVKRVHWSELVVKTRPTIKEDDYPEAAKALHLPETRCVVRITVDEKGVPTSVAPSSCPEIFQDAGVKVGMRYRFYPYKQDGKATSVYFDLTLNFKP